VYCTKACLRHDYYGIGNTSFRLLAQEQTQKRLKFVVRIKNRDKTFVLQTVYLSLTIMNANLAILT